VRQRVRAAIKALFYLLYGLSMEGGSGFRDLPQGWCPVRPGRCSRNKVDAAYRFLLVCDSGAIGQKWRRNENAMVYLLGCIAADRPI